MQRNQFVATDYDLRSSLWVWSGYAGPSKECHTNDFHSKTKNCSFFVLLKTISDNEFILLFVMSKLINSVWFWKIFWESLLMLLFLNWSTDKRFNFLKTLWLKNKNPFACTLLIFRSTSSSSPSNRKDEISLAPFSISVVYFRMSSMTIFFLSVTFNCLALLLGTRNEIHLLAQVTCTWCETEYTPELHTQSRCYTMSTKRISLNSSG